MPKKTTQITPEIQKVLDLWKRYADLNHIMVSPASVIGEIAFKAKVNVDYHGACICLQKIRLQCPCKQCLDEINEFGLCWCRVFCSQAYLTNPSKFKHETFSQASVWK